MHLRYCTCLKRPYAHTVHTVTVPGRPEIETEPFNLDETTNHARCLGGQQREVTHFNPLNGLHIHTAHTYQYNNTALDVTVCTYRQFCTGVQERNTVRLCDVLCCDGTPRKQPPEAATRSSHRSAEPGHGHACPTEPAPAPKVPKPKKTQEETPGRGRWTYAFRPRLPSHDATRQPRCRSGIQAAIDMLCLSACWAFSGKKG